MSTPRAPRGYRILKQADGYHLYAPGGTCLKVTQDRDKALHTARRHKGRPVTISVDRRSSLRLTTRGRVVANFHFVPARLFDQLPGTTELSGPAQWKSFEAVCDGVPIEITVFRSP